MVPVKKPGRPLSACPHPRDQQCGCGGVTAAIPRRQTCGCGTSTPPLSGQATPQHSHGDSMDASSPTNPTFKVQKTTSRPSSSRKQSYDPANFGRVDMNSVNIVPFEHGPQGVSLPFMNGYVLPGAPPTYKHIAQYANIQPQLSHITIQTPFDTRPGRTNGFSKENGNELEDVVENPLATPTDSNSKGLKGAAIGGSCCATAPTSGTNGTAKGGSCCAPKQPSQSHSSSSLNSNSKPQEVHARSCCSSKPAPQMIKQEPMSSHSPLNMTPQILHQILPPNGLPFNPALYPQYLPQTTVFTYPPTYGSLQNPLRPSAWRQSVRANSYGQPQMEPPLPPSNPPFGIPVAENLDTVHTCSCGDACQCIGCAAHPYNDATQDYVRSAWSSMNGEQEPSETYAYEYSNGNGHSFSPGAEKISPPTANTPSSATSATGEEQSLSASDFFFVNYPFSSEDGCGGDTESCPCGDDCQCLGCTIHHQQPPMPCEGEKDSCPCGDECECIGCEIHNGTIKI